MNGNNEESNLFCQGQAGEMQMIFLNCMDLFEQVKSGRWKHGGIAGIKIWGDMVKKQIFPDEAVRGLRPPSAF
jgi:hypothetical protein